MPDIFAQTAVNVLADIAVRYVVEITQRLRHGKDDRAEHLPVEFSVFENGGEARLDLREHIRVRFEKLMVDFIAVEREYALRGEKVRYGRLAAAGAARHADEPHAGEQRVFYLFLCQRALAQNFEGLLRQIEDRGLA